MAEYPKISIVTPCYNDIAFLERTMLSVLDQGYPNLEYIVMDGGSTDGCVEVIKKYADRLAWWVSEKDQGMYFAIQKGFEKSTGDVMGWINSDDMLHPGSLFSLGQIFRDFSHISWVQGQPNTIDAQDRIVSSWSWPEISLLYFYKKNRDTRKYIQQESTFWRRSLWEKAGGKLATQYKLAGDFELWIRFFQYEKLYHLTTCLGSFRVSGGGQASIDQFDRYVSETNAILVQYPLTSAQKSQLAGLERMDTTERFFTRAFRWLRRKRGLNDPTSVTDQIFFNGTDQKFNSRS